MLLIVHMQDPFTEDGFSHSQTWTRYLDITRSCHNLPHSITRTRIRQTWDQCMVARYCYSVYLFTSVRSILIIGHHYDYYCCRTSKCPS